MVLRRDKNLLGLTVHLQLMHGAHMRHQRNKADARQNDDDCHDDQHLGHGEAFSIPNSFHHISHLN